MLLKLDFKEPNSEQLLVLTEAVRCPCCPESEPLALRASVSLAAKIGEKFSSLPFRLLQGAGD